MTRRCQEINRPPTNETAGWNTRGRMVLMAPGHQKEDTVYTETPCNQADAVLVTCIRDLPYVGGDCITERATYEVTCGVKTLSQVCDDLMSDINDAIADGDDHTPFARAVDTVCWIG